ncbi:MAG TPA: roadblock/LC7 domain-containing protein [Polyangia bacterium]|nr:roadblock/LC7 domain-containing protein [Polyangia bacterium]
MNQLSDVCERLLRDTNALSVVLVDERGGVVARAGDATRLDSDALSSLASDGRNLAALIADPEFREQFHRGTAVHVHFARVAERLILAVAFDFGSSLGLVRLRVRRARAELAAVFATN